MSSKIFIAIMATGIVMSSCDWLKAKNNISQALDLEGKWQLDSLSEGRDSSKGIGKLLLATNAPAQTDTASILTYEFLKDSMITVSPAVHPDTAKYTVSNNVIKIMTADSSGQTLVLSIINNDRISLSDTDGSAMFLKKVK